METRRLDAATIDTVVAEAGAGGRPLLHVHGFTGAREDFEDWVDPLARAGWHVVAPDLRGHGDAAKPRGVDQYSLEQYADDVLALADTLGWARFALLGHSMGGMIVQLVALRAPERVEALILMDTHHGMLEVEPDVVAAVEQIATEQGMRALADTLGDTQGGPFDSPATQRMFRERPERKAQSHRNTAVCSVDMYLAMADELLGLGDRLSLLHRIEVPTLVVVGEQDEPFVEASRRMADVITGARLAVIPGAGHSPQLETPDAWWAEVSAFLAARQEEAR